MNNKEYIKDLSTTLTVGIILTYILGYLVVTGFLSNYGIFNDDLLNLNFLKSGLVFLIALVPILFIINYKNKSYAEVFSEVILYVVGLSLLFIDFKILNFILYLAYIVLYYFFMKKQKVLYFVLISILPLTLLIILSIKYSYLFDLYKTIFFTCLFSIVILFVLKIKKFGVEYFVANIIFICLVSYYFGSHVYEHLPPSFKGGFPNSTFIMCKEESKSYLNNIGFDFNDTTFSDNVTIYYSSNDKLLILKNDNYFFLSKDLFYGFKTSAKN